MKKINKLFLIIFIFLISITNVYAEEFNNVSSKNVILLNLNDDSVIYEKDADEKVNIASLTKIMTLIVSIENITNFDEEIYITNDMLNTLANDLSVVGFEEGEIVDYNDLLYGTILKSGADATHILALKVAGSEKEFANMMNIKAKQLGMENSSFANSFGIEQENHYSSARDLSILLKYALKNDKFKEIYTTKHYITKNQKHDMNGPLNYITSSDKMNMQYVLGAKTGYTKKAGLCLSSIANYDNIDYMLITIGADYTDRAQAIKDSKTIYEYYFNNYGYNTILSKSDILVEGKTIYEVSYKIKAKKTVKKYIKNISNKNDLKYIFDGDVTLGKNIRKGDKIGTFYIEYDGEKLYEEQIKSPITVHITFKYFIKNNKVLLCGICALLMVLALVIINRKKKNKKR